MVEQLQGLLEKFGDSSSSKKRLLLHIYRILTWIQKRDHYHTSTKF